jgi:hypothetical protein
MADLDQNGVQASADAPQPDRSSRRRKRAVIGVVGLAAVLGGGAFFVTSAMTSGETVIRDTGALAPMASPESPSATGSTSAARPSPTESVTSKRSGRTTDEQIAAARSAAAKDGVPLQRPLTAPKVVAQAMAPTVTNIGSVRRDGAAMRIISAKYDLTGQRELAWAADNGERVGSARCTQKFHFSDGGAVRELPTMLLCWHTSAGKSVITVAVTREGRPSMPASVATIDEQWAELG